MPVSLENSNGTPVPVHGGVGQMLKAELYLDADFKGNECLPFCSNSSKVTLPTSSHSCLSLSPHALILLLFKFTNNSV